VGIQPADANQQPAQKDLPQAPRTVKVPIKSFGSVLQAYSPRTSDELALIIGGSFHFSNPPIYHPNNASPNLDRIYVEYKHADGWAWGISSTTGLKGLFPLAFIAMPGDPLQN
jgi:hypothetical protein